MKGNGDSPLLYPARQRFISLSSHAKRDKNLCLAGYLSRQ